MQPIRTKCKYGYIVFAITLLIAIDYVYRYFAFEPYNQSPLNIETPEGNAQPYHPSVVYNPGGWNGYAYWMAETPYPLGPDGDWNGLPPYRARWETPCIHASHDGIHWETPGDLVNPIDDLNETEIENRDFFSDTHLVMNGDTLEEIAEKLGYKNHSGVLKRIRKIGQAYEAYTGVDYGFENVKITG